MSRNQVFGIAAVVICSSAIVKLTHLPFTGFADNVMRIALISGIAFLIIDKYRNNRSRNKK